MPTKEKQEPEQVTETAPATLAPEVVAGLQVYEGFVAGALAAEDAETYIKAEVPEGWRDGIRASVATARRRDAAGDVIAAWGASRLFTVLGEHVLKVARMRTFVFEDAKSAHPTNADGATITLDTAPDYRQTPRKNEPKPLRGDIAAAAAALVSSDALVSFLSDAVGITNEQAAYVLANVADSITNPPA